MSDAGRVNFDSLYFPFKKEAIFRWLLARDTVQRDGGIDLWGLLASRFFANEALPARQLGRSPRFVSNMGGKRGVCGVHGA